MTSSSQETAQMTLAADTSDVIPPHDRVAYHLKRQRGARGFNFDSGTAYRQCHSLGGYLLQQTKSVAPGASLALHFYQKDAAKGGVCTLVNEEWKYSKRPTSGLVHRVGLATYDMYAEGVWQFSKAAQRFACNDKDKEVCEIIRTLALSSLKSLSQKPEYRDILASIFTTATQSSSSQTTPYDDMIEGRTLFFRQSNKPFLQLIEIIKKGHLKKEQIFMLVTLFISAGVPLSKGEKDFHTPLSFAAQIGKDEIVSMLLTAGADKDEPRGCGATPLLIAAREGHENVVRLLLAAGADKNRVRPQLNTTPLYAAAQKGHHHIVDLLQKEGADVEAAYACAQERDNQSAMALLHPYLPSLKTPSALQDDPEQVPTPASSIMKQLEELILCPITQEVMIDPVVAADGYTYERSAIELWLSKDNKSPMTNLPLRNKSLLRNQLVRQIIEAYNTSKAFEATIPQGAGRLATAHGAFSQPSSSRVSKMTNTQVPCSSFSRS